MPRAKQLKSTATRKPMLRVAYFVSRQPHSKGKLETRYGVLRVRGSWRDEATHAKIARRIMERNRGWQVGGYTPNSTITPIADAAGRPVGIR